MKYANTWDNTILVQISGISTTSTSAMSSIVLVVLIDPITCDDLVLSKCRTLHKLYKYIQVLRSTLVYTYYVLDLYEDLNIKKYEFAPYMPIA